MKFGSLLMCLMLFSGAAHSQYSLQIAFPNLPAFSNPIEMQSPPDGSNRIFIAQQKGKIYFFQNTPSVNSRKLFADLSGIVTQSGGEMGLLGFAFHPNFKTNGFFYVNFTSDVGGQLTSFITRFQVSASNPDTVLISSRQDLLTVDQPYQNHNGGCLGFGNDGYLYASFGDGGSGGDPQKNGQNRTVLLGKILRIDVDHESGGNHYDIPLTNPYAAGTQGFRKEIYAYGLRNTWKFSFDRTTSTLWAADVGQNAYEEVDTIINGGNYGWNLMEGFHRYDGIKGDTTQMILPLWEYGRSLGASTTGGYVYRGSAIPSLLGKYIYGDYVTARVWALATGNGPVTNQLINENGAVSALSISSFGEDQDKNVYVVGWGNGRLYKLVSTEPSDIEPPVFSDSIYSTVFQQFVRVHDDRTTDQGLKSISWVPTANTDSSKFTVTYSPAIKPCQTDKDVHVISLERKDTTIGGCFDFTFEDCAGNKSYHQVCMNRIFEPPSPDTLKPLFEITQSQSMRDQFKIVAIDNRKHDKGIDSVIYYNKTNVESVDMDGKCSPLVTSGFRVMLMGRDVHICIRATDCSGNITDTCILYNSDTTNFIVSENKPAILSLQTNNPNPFSGKTMITYSLSEYAPVRLSLYDMVGKEVTRIFDAPQQQGSHTLEFDGSKLSAGNYILRLESGRNVVSKKIVKE